MFVSLADTRIVEIRRTKCMVMTYPGESHLTQKYNNDDMNNADYVSKVV